jgi:hypothetical protein
MTPHKSTFAGRITLLEPPPLLQELYTCRCLCMLCRTCLTLITAALPSSVLGIFPRARHTSEEKPQGRKQLTNHHVCFRALAQPNLNACRQQDTCAAAAALSTNLSICLRTTKLRHSTTPSVLYAACLPLPSWPLVTLGLTIPAQHRLLAGPLAEPLQLRCRSKGGPVDVALFAQACPLSPQ